MNHWVIVLKFLKTEIVAQGMVLSFFSYLWKKKKNWAIESGTRLNMGCVYCWRIKMLLRIKGDLSLGSQQICSKCEYYNESYNLNQFSPVFIFWAIPSLSLENVPLQTWCLSVTGQESRAWAGYSISRHLRHIQRTSAIRSPVHLAGFRKGLNILSVFRLSVSSHLANVKTGSNPMVQGICFRSYCVLSGNINRKMLCIIARQAF